MAEIGSIGMPCAAPTAIDEVHLLSDKIAVIQRERPVGPGGLRVGALLFATLLASCPKLMRPRGPRLRVRLRRPRILLAPAHDSQLREDDRRGHDLRGELIALVEEVLPARFGGDPTDYQLAEEEEAGLSRISVIVSPRRGAIDDRRVLETVLEVLRKSSRAHEMRTDVWQQANALRVVRREPHVTSAAKILPLSVPGAGARDRARPTESG